MQRFPVPTHELMKWPEWLAFSRRLGIDLSLPTTCITIMLDIEAMVEIEHEYQGCDTEQEKKEQR